VIRHLLKLVWKRKRSSALLTLEILISFLVLFGVGVLAATGISRYRKPLGFEYNNVWVANVSIPQLESPTSTSETSTTGWQEQMRARRAPEARFRADFDRIMRELRAMPQIESVAATGAPAFSGSTWSSITSFGGRPVEMIRDSVTDGYDQVMRTKLVRGRWFTAEDDAANLPPMVIDTDLARAMFPDRDALGQKFSFDDGDDYRIVGIIAPFRKRGEFSEDKVQMAFDRVSLTGWRGEMPRAFVIRVKPGTPAEFEEALTAQLHALAPDYGIRIRHMDAMRRAANQEFLAPMTLGVIVGAFLIFMVALGLSGVLWQNVTRRRREIGLRRALGATGGSVHRQILIEVALLATLAVTIGVVIVAQLPILGLFKLVTPAAYAIGIGAALATIYALTLLCGLYPSWLAGRVQPAEALHYE
jgi:putative ABC transport system permease protein